MCICGIISRFQLLSPCCGQVVLSVGDLRFEGDLSIICICSGRYYGGGFMPVPDAMPDDGVLDMLYIKKVALPRLPGLVGKYAKGKYRTLTRYITDYHGQSVTFSSRQPILAVVDGEVMEDTHFTVSLSDRKVNFFYPAYAGYSVEISTPSASL